MSDCVKNSKAPADNKTTSCCGSFSLEREQGTHNVSTNSKTQHPAHNSSIKNSVEHKEHNHSHGSCDHPHSPSDNGAHSKEGDSHQGCSHGHEEHSHEHEKISHSHEGHNHDHDHNHEGGSCAAAPGKLDNLGGSQAVEGGLRTEIRIMQMDCPVEENLIKKKLGGMSAVKELDFNLMQRILTVTHTTDSWKRLWLRFVL